jgi:hypothetical protein
LNRLEFDQVHFSNFEFERVKQRKVGASMLECWHGFKFDQKIVIVRGLTSGRASKKLKPFDPVLTGNGLKLLKWNHKNSLIHFRIKRGLESTFREMQNSSLQ